MNKKNKLTKNKLTKNYLNKIGNIVDLKRYKKFVSPIEGGSTRQESVFKALSFLWNAHIQDDDIILIHDAARPFISQKIIDDNISLCKTFGAANTAIKVVDSLCKSIDGITIYDSVERKHIFQSQTPQTFRFGTIFNAHQNAKGDVTDDVQLVASYGFKIAIVEGSSLNFKITTKDDLELAKLLSKKTA